MELKTVKTRGFPDQFFMLLIAPLMELKSGNIKQSLKLSDRTFNRTAYGIENSLHLLM